MTFEQVWRLLLIAPPLLWMIFASYRSRTAGRFDIKGRFDTNTFGILLLLTFGLTGFVLRKSNVDAAALAQPLTGLSDTDLSQGKRRIYLIETNDWQDLSES